MTIEQAIAKADREKPNGYPMSDKIAWLSTLDGNIKRDIIDTHEDGEDVVFDGYDDDTLLSTELLVPAPYDEIYDYWLQAMVDYQNGEIPKYNNSLVKYNEFLSAFRNNYNSLHMPKGNRFRYY